MATTDGVTETTVHVTKAPPPLLAVAVIGAVISVALYLFPTIAHIDEVANPALFTKTQYPKFVSLTAMIYVRLMFATLCFVVSIHQVFSEGILLQTSYLPDSKLNRAPIFMKGFRMLFPFTFWCWNLLGTTFALSGYIAMQADAGSEVSPWLLRTTLCLWEISAPMTLLVGAVVKYALWPIQVKKNGGPGSFQTTRSLLQHNANVAMALTELAFLGGLPVLMAHISLPVLLGSTYVLFSWATMNILNPKAGPAFLYFFFDTTLGNKMTFFLVALLFVMGIFYSIFCGVESLLDMFGSGLQGHAIFVLLVFTSVTRFR